jgi:hypothetical protein
MSKIYRTARGDPVDMDILRLSNESTIAIGNMRTNARGDELGPGGKIVRTRAQIMQEYHKLNTPIASDEISVDTGEIHTQSEVNNTVAPIAEDTLVTEIVPVTEFVKPRGSFAESIADQTEVTQTLLEPASSRNTPTGVTRI